MKGSSLLVAALICIGSASVTHAQSQELTVKPDKCVSLRKGQVCYQRINISWDTDITGHYCILASGQESPLKCWNNKSTGKLSYTLESTESVKFDLVNKSVSDENNKLLTLDQLIATATVTIAWVYNTKSRSRTTWRLF